MAYIKVYDSTNSSRGITPTSGQLYRGELGDVFDGTSDVPNGNVWRDTFVHNNAFTIGKYDDWEMSLRFDVHTQSTSDHFNLMSIRQESSTFTNNCEGGGNSRMHAVRIEVNRAVSPDHYSCIIQGGSSPWETDSGQNRKTIDLGPIVQGETHTFRFRIHWHWATGSAEVYKDGTLMFSNPSTPVGFHYLCDRSTPAPTDIRVQHGIYTHTTGAQKLTSSGLGFTYSSTTAFGGTPPPPPPPPAPATPLSTYQGAFTATFV